MKTYRYIETVRDDKTFDYLVLTLELGEGKIIVDDIHTSRKVSIEELKKFLHC
jgi:hypothetical protein